MPVIKALCKYLKTQVTVKGLAPSTKIQTSSAATFIQNFPIIGQGAYLEP